MTGTLNILGLSTLPLVPSELPLQRFSGLILVLFGLACWLVVPLILLGSALVPLGLLLVLP